MSESPSPQPSPAPQVLVLTKAKECKHSVVYESTEPEAFVTSIYLMRRAISGPMPQQITLTLEVK